MARKGANQACAVIDPVQFKINACGENSLRLQRTARGPDAFRAALYQFIRFQFRSAAGKEMQLQVFLKTCNCIRSRVLHLLIECNIEKGH